MLVLSRQRDESLIFDFIEMTDEQLLALRTLPPIETRVVDIRGDKVSLGITAPKSVKVHRKEVYNTIKRERKAGIKPPASPAEPREVKTEDTIYRRHP